MSTPSSPLDLAAFFGLSDEEASSLGLEPSSLEQADGLEATAADVTAPPALDHVDAPLPAAPTEAGSSEAPISAMARELMSVFMEEAAELLDSLHASLETLEHTPSAALVIEARRAVHTIKGGARMCGLPALTDLAHACEDLIGPVTAATDALPPPQIALLFEAEQEMRAALSVPTLGPGSAESARALIRRLRSPVTERTPPAGATRRSGTAVPGPAATDARREAPASPDAPASAVAAPVSGPGVPSTLLRRPVIQAVSPHGNRLAVDLRKVEDIVAKVTEVVANRAASHGLMESLSATVTESMRTVHRLQALMTQLQYHVVSRGLDVAVAPDPDGLDLETFGPVRQLLLQLHEAVGDQQALVQETADLVTRRRALAAVETRLDTELQGALLNMRLMPVSQLRVRLDQVVRSAAIATGREVRWTMEGQHVALDKQVCDRLFEPLLHLVRNAVDHGIEPPEERESKGKPRAGHILVQAQVEGNQATVSVSDDGRGMDPQRIARVAIARGVLTEEQAHRLSNREKLELIFRPGFSTAPAVTEMSGRGMGMEIVRETCTRMGGTVTISPRTGGGTVVTLQVPLSMSVIHALIVRDHGLLLAVPAAQLLSVHLVRAIAVVTREEGAVVRIGREEIPLHRLPAGRTRPHPPSSTVEGEFSVLVTRFHGERVALAVDEVANEEDLIVKPLPVLLQGVDRLLGAVILADGTAAPVLNLPPLLDQILLQGAVSAPPPDAAPKAAPVILVVDDSLTMRATLTRMLEHAGYAVLTARDGQEALELIRLHGMPLLVTLDIEMPRMDGLETLYAIRHIPGAEAIPIFMLTSRAGQQHQRTAMKLGATRYFSKPYHDREFLQAVHEAAGATLRSAS